MNTNQKGFTLIEVIMALGLSTMVIMGMLYTSKMMFDIKKNSDQNFEIVSTIGEVSMALNKEPICTSFNLDQVLFDPSDKITLSELKVSPSDKIFALNDKISNNLTVTKIFIDNFQVAQSAVTYTDYFADLNIEIQRDSGIGAKQVIRKLPVNIIAENISVSQAKVVRCRANDPIVDSATILANGVVDNNTLPSTFNTATCALFGGVFNSSTNLCENTTVSIATNSSVPSSELRCGQCLHGGGSTIDIPCMGQSLCGTTASCPANFNLIRLNGSSTSINVGSEKYCQPM